MTNLAHLCLVAKQPSNLALERPHGFLPGSLSYGIVVEHYARRENHDWPNERKRIPARICAKPAINAWERSGGIQLRASQRRRAHMISIC